MEYHRDRAVAYAHQWAYQRNRDYADFETMGGNCTNFASQCLYAGSGVMNYSGIFGWYYRSLNDRAPAWTGVEYLHRFLTGNLGAGPHARELPIAYAELGDIIQLRFHGRREFSHSLVVVSTGRTPVPGNVLIAANTDDADYRPVSSYTYEKLRLLHIAGVR